MTTSRRTVLTALALAAAALAGWLQGQAHQSDAGALAAGSMPQRSASPLR